MKIHPAAELFPILEGKELEALTADIKANGLRFPILTLDDKILDGRNRMAACKAAGVEPKFKALPASTDPLAFVISANLARRHLSESQRAMIAEKIANLDDGQKASCAKLRTSAVPQDKAAAMMNVSRRSVQTARKVRQESPALAEKVERGELTLNKAAKALRKTDSEKKQRKALAAIDPEQKSWTMTDDQSIVKCETVITDPPYGILKEPWEPKGLEKFTRKWLGKWNDCGADTFLACWSQRHLWDGRVWMDDELSKYKFQQLLIWHYPNNKSPQSREGFKQTWEPIFFYRRKDSTRKICVGGSEWGEGLNDFDCHVAAVPQTNFNGAEMKQHPAQKPVSVFRWLINATTQPGETVCDPFAGSGTSGIAAVQLNRIYHGIEIDPAFLRMANERIAAYGK